MCAAAAGCSCDSRRPPQPRNLTRSAVPLQLSVQRDEDEAELLAAAGRAVCRGVDDHSAACVVHVTEADVMVAAASAVAAAAANWSQRSMISKH
jgi:hypothetical protein